MEKYLPNKFHIWKNAYHRDFKQISERIELEKFVW